MQCRNFPFWPEMVDKPKAWFQTASYCPVIGKGDLVQIDVARAQAQEMREALPHMYK